MKATKLSKKYNRNRVMGIILLCDRTIVYEKNIRKIIKIEFE